MRKLLGGLLIQRFSGESFNILWPQSLSLKESAIILTMLGTNNGVAVLQKNDGSLYRIKVEDSVTVENKSAPLYLREVTIALDWIQSNKAQFRVIAPREISVYRTELLSDNN